jgi:monoamine oxidase
MAKTPLMRLLRRALAEADYSATRRSFLRTSAVAAAVASTPLFLEGCSKAVSSQVDRAVKVAVVGAGIAGLHATWLLKKAGVNVELFEGSKRIGGRAFTGNNVVVEGSTAELGGEWLDTKHHDMLTLAKTFGVELIDKLADTGDEVDAFHFNGRAYTMQDIVREIRPFLARIAEDVARLPENLVDLHKSEAKKLDAMSIDAYLTSIGMTGWLRSLIEVAYVTENGLELNEQSALNFILLIGKDLSGGELEFFGDSDERYVMRGGVQGITSGLFKSVETNTHLNHLFTGLEKDGDQFIVSFTHEGKNVRIAAAYVVLAVPFSVLRDIPLNVDLPEKKRRVIKELAYGTNGKVLFGFTERYWTSKGFSGWMYTEPPLQQLWENTHEPNPKGAGLTMFYGGKSADVIRKMSDDELRTLIAKTMQSVWGVSDSVMPSRLFRMDWPTQPFVKGSYSTYAPGQWTEFYGVAGEPVGNLHFAGEHCSLKSQGYLNGGAETGRIAAERILKAVQ